MTTITLTLYLKVNSDCNLVISFNLFTYTREKY